MVHIKVILLLLITLGCRTQSKCIKSIPLDKAPLTFKWDGFIFDKETSFYLDNVNFGKGEAGFIKAVERISKMPKSSTLIILLENVPEGEGGETLYEASFGLKWSRLLDKAISDSQLKVFSP